MSSNINSSFSQVLFKQAEGVATSAVQAVNPLAQLPQSIARQQLLKEIRQKQHVIRWMEARVKQLSPKEPKTADSMRTNALTLKGRVNAMKDQAAALALEETFERIGKFSTVTDYVVPGAGNVITAVSLAGKAANVAWQLSAHDLTAQQKNEMIQRLAKEILLAYLATVACLVATYAISKIF